MTSDGRLIIREDDDEDVKDKGETGVLKFVQPFCTLLYCLNRLQQEIITFPTDEGEMKDILEEAGVKSVSTST